MRNIFKKPKGEVPVSEAASSTSPTDTPLEKTSSREADSDAKKSIEVADLEEGKAADPTDSSDDIEYPGKWKATVIIAAVFLAIFLVALDQTIIGTAIPRITDQFHSVADVGWYGSAYFLTSTALQPSWGRIYKILNVRLSLSIYSLSSQGEGSR